MDENGLINELGEIIYVSDPITYELLYANDYCKSVMISSDYKGKKCYEMLQGKEEPCEFCTNHRLARDEFYAWEFSNPVMGRHFLLKDKLIDWYGKPARMEIAVDITERENVSQSVQRKLRTEQTIVECIRALTQESELEASMRAVLSGIGRFYQADRVYILESGGRGKTVGKIHEWRAAGEDAPSAEASGKEAVLIMPFLGQAAENQGGVAVLRDVEALKADFPEEYERLRRNGVRGMLASPFAIQDKGTGYIGVVNPSCNGDDPSLLESLSYFVVNELQKRRMQTELEYRSSHDALTGLYNRFRYMQYLNSEEAGTLNCAGVVFCDINGLKQINDTLGHPAGDRTIIRTARALTECFPGALVYRMSGDEFVVVCANIEQSVFDREVKQAVERLASECYYGVSVGAVWEDADVELGRLERYADELMYQNKQSYYREHPAGDRRH